MKFSCKVDIDLPRERVVELFDNPDNMQHWQDDFISFEQLAGDSGSVGATAKVTYKRVVLTETIIENNLPESFHGSYEGSWGKNLMKNYFDVLDSGTTRWRSEVDYLEMNGLVMKLMKTLMPNMFRKQTQKWMDQFKVFAENEGPRP